MGVPQSILIPFVGVEFDSSRAVAGPALVPITALLIGQKTATGTGTEKTKIRITSADEARVKAGVGSVAHRMAKRWFKNNKITDVDLILLDDAATSTAATQVVVFLGTATETGELVLYIAGTRIAIGVVVGDDLDIAGAAFVAAINALTDLPVTAAYAAGDLTLTCKNKGVAAGDLDVRKNYYQGEEDVAGLDMTIGTYIAGTVDPDIQDAIDAIGDTWYNVIAQPYNDSTNLDAIEVYNLAQAGPMVQHDGMWYCAKRDTLANMITFGIDTNRNNQYVTALPANKRPCSTYELVAGVAAVTAQSIAEDPAVPLHRLTLQGFLPVDENDRWDAIERNQLAQNGIATISDGNGVQTESTVTMYLRNSAAAADTAYQFQNTLYVLMRLRYTFRNRILTKYSRAKLANNADRIEAGQQVMTPNIGKAEAVAWFKIEERAGQVEGIDQFKEELVVRKNAINVNRLDWLLPPDLINQFIIGSADMQFQLQAQEG